MQYWKTTFEDIHDIIPSQLQYKLENTFEDIGEEKNIFTILVKCWKPTSEDIGEDKISSQI